MWGFPPFQSKLVSCVQLTFSSHTTKKPMLPFSCLIAHKSQGKSCAGSTAGDHCSVQVDRKATAWKAEEVIVPLIGRPGKEITGCHTWRHSTQCALPALGKQGGNNRTVPSPPEAASRLFDTLPQTALLIQLMEGCYFSTIKCYILETLKQILISSKHPTCLCHKFLGCYGRRFKIA